MDKTASNFEALLTWLHPDRAQAAEKFEQIRRSLIRIFQWNGCADAESLADEVFDRVLLKVSTIRQAYLGDPSLYFYAVAKKILRDSKRSSQRAQKSLEALQQPETIRNESTEKMYDCLERCLSALDPPSRDLILEYYRVGKTEEISNTKERAQESKLSSGAHRARIHRIRTRLASCVQTCMEREGAV